MSKCRICRFIYSLIYFAQNTIKTRKTDNIDEQDNKVLHTNSCSEHHKAKLTTQTS